MVSPTTTSSSQKQKSIAPEDRCVTYQGQDGITSLSWSPTSNHLASGNWDGKVSVWRVEHHGDGTTVRFTEVLQYQHRDDDGRGQPQPALDVCWSADGSEIYSGGGDRKVRVAKVVVACTAASGQALGAVIGTHTQPVKVVRYCQKHNCIVSGSWDGTIKFWQTGNPNPLLLTLQLPAQIYSLDVRGEVMVVGLADRTIVAYDLSGSCAREVSREESPLPYQTRVISIFNDAAGYAVGDACGRVGVQYFDTNKKMENKDYLLHKIKEKLAGGKENTHLYSVNSIAFHTTPGIMATAGSDGGVIFADIYNKMITKRFPKIELPIPACAFNKDGDLFAYASSYDWSKGMEHAPPKGNEMIFVHCVKPDSVKPKPKKKN